MIRRTTIITILVLSLAWMGCENNETPSKDTPNGSELKDTLLPDRVYGSHDRQRYDIHLPAGRDSNTPVVLMIHGGAWKGGDKGEMAPYVDLLRKKWADVAVVNMNYRLASNTHDIHHPEMMADISAVILDVINKKDDYQVSPTMGILGGSAGAQLAMIYSYAHDDFDNIRCVASLFGPTIINDWDWYSSTNIWLGGKVGDILTEYVGQAWDPTVYKQVSPYSRIHENSAPTIIFHGSLDPIVPVYQSQWMQAKLDSLGVPNAYNEYFAFHGFDAAQNDDMMTKAVAFFKEYLK